MLKLLGSGMILLGGALAVMLRLAERGRRCQAEDELVAALERLGEAIRQTHMPLPRLLVTLAEGRCPSVRAFLSGTAEALRRGEELDAAWRRCADVLPLPPEDLRVLAALGAALGGDEEQACKAAARAAEELSRRAAQRAAGRKDEDRRAAALCFSAAALLVILLI